MLRKENNFRLISFKILMASSFEPASFFLVINSFLRVYLFRSNAAKYKKFKVKDF